MNKGTAIIAILVAFVGGYFMGNFVSKPGKKGSAASAAAGASSSIEDQEKALGPGDPNSDRTRVLVGPSDPVLGSDKALVTIIEFSDFQCPYCKRGADVVHQIAKAYPQDVRIIFKQNPLAFHKDAVPAAKAALAAQEQGKFWEMHDLLFTNPQKLDRASLEQYAQQLGLDMTKFKAGLDGDKFKARIDDDMKYAARVGARGTPTFFVNGKVVRGAQPFEQFKTLIDAEIATSKKLMADKKVAAGAPLYAEIMRSAKPASAAADVKPQQAGQPDPAKTYKVTVGSSPFKGPATAKLTIIEFSDFECPFCTKVEPTLAELEKKYGKDVRIVWKNNPLPMHQNAPLAAEAGFAAHEQGKFWEMHAKLYANQRALDRASLEKYAQEIGLDMAKFKAALDTKKFQKAVQDDMALAAQFGVRGTPSFFINGRPLRGAQPLDAFVKLCDEELAQADELLKKGTPAAALYDEIIKDGETKVAAAPQQPPRRGPDPSVTYKLEVAPTDPTLGPATAKVTIIEFSDFQCPFCAKAAPAAHELAKKYPKDVRVIFKQLPLPMHSNAQIAAEAALAAHAQGKFWQMHDKMFENQKALDRASLEKYAQEIGLNVPKFKAALDAGTYKAAVQKDAAMAAQFAVNGTPTFFVNGRIYRGAPTVEGMEPKIVEEMGKADELLKKGTPAKNLYATIIKDGQTSVAAAPAPAADTTVYKVDPGSSPSLGNAKAPVTIIVFTDFQCPFCSRAVPTVHELAKLYPNDVRIVLKNLPLGMHPNAPLAAQAGLAAHEQGKFWEMHDKMFANQQKLDRASLDQFAQELGLDVAKFKAALDSGKYKAAVDADAKQAQGAGISGTPTFLINGRKLAGAQPIQQFRTIIDEELAKAKGGAKPVIQPLRPTPKPLAPAPAQP